jgi:hypothetical protein
MRFEKVVHKEIVDGQLMVYALFHRRSPVSE